MNIPTLPTDNIYKFVAIFGLISFLFSFYVSHLDLDELHNINMGLDAFNIEHEYDKGIYDLYDSIYISNRDKLFTALDNDSISSEEIQDLKVSFDASFKQKSKLISKWEKSTIEGKILLARLDYYENKNKYYEDWAVILRIVGGMLMLVGFSLWYYNHQIYIDAEKKWKGRRYILKLNKEKERDNTPIFKESIDDNKTEIK